MHNLKELTRQYDNAKGRAQVAKADEDAALKRLRDALVAERLAILAADGIKIGSIVEAFETPYLGRPEAHLGQFVVLGASMHFYYDSTLSSARAVLVKMRKDGTPGRQKADVSWRYDRLALVAEDAK